MTNMLSEFHLSSCLGSWFIMEISKVDMWDALNRRVRNSTTDIEGRCVVYNWTTGAFPRKSRRLENIRGGMLLMYNFRNNAITYKQVKI